MKWRENWSEIISGFVDPTPTPQDWGQKKMWTKNQSCSKLAEIGRKLVSAKIEEI